MEELRCQIKYVLKPGYDATIISSENLLLDGGIGEIEEIDWMRKCWASRSTLFASFFSG